MNCILIFETIIIRAMGFPTEFFPVLFAIPRMAGYLAHWRESLDDPDTKIMRPQQVRSSSSLFYFILFYFFVRPLIFYCPSGIHWCMASSLHATSRTDSIKGGR